MAPEEASGEAPAKHPASMGRRLLPALPLLVIGAIFIYRAYQAQRRALDQTEHPNPTVGQATKKINAAIRAFEVMSKAISARAEGRLDKAEDLYRLAFHELKDAGEHESAMGVSCLCGLGQVCHERGKRGQAESVYKQALSLCEKGDEWVARDRDSSLMPVLEAYAKLLRDMGRKGEAERLEARAKALRREATPEQAPGAEGA